MKSVPFPFIDHAIPTLWRGEPIVKSSLLGIVIIAALGGLLFGFDTAVISGTTDSLKEVFELSPGWLGFTMASALIGTIFGAMFAGKPADIIGRRALLFWIAIAYFISAVGSALAWNLWSFILFRFLGGLGVGAASATSPLYITEISPARYRGRMVAITQFNIVLGILLAYLSNYLVSRCDFGASEWRWMFGIEAFPAALFFFLLFLTPRSPRWLLAKQRDTEAREILNKYGSDDVNVDDEIETIKDSLDLERHSASEPLFQNAYRKPIFLVIAIAAFNQLSGINAILYYAPAIFKSAGFGEDAGLLNSVGLGAMNLIFTMAALAIIDHFGRRRLMIVGSIGYILSLGATAATFYTQSSTVQNDAGKMVRQFSGTGGWIVFAGLLVFIASHAFGQGAVIWVFISEIFPNRVRAKGQALGCFTHWVMAAAISWTFPMIAEASGGHTFAFYAAMMVLQLYWVLKYMPETKQIPLEQIQQQLGIE